MHVTHRGPRRPGLRALFGEASLQPGKVNAQTIGFVIGPRLNAAGRLSTAEIGYRLLNAMSEDEAREPAAELGRLNSVTAGHDARDGGAGKSAAGRSRAAAAS